MIKRIEGFIDDQRSLSHEMIGKYSNIKTFYWGKSQPTEWSLCPVPRGKRKNQYLRIQLLQTPKLIVDIPPLSEDRFIETFGFNYDQFAKLLECGYITPNMYHFQNETWRDYADPSVKILTSLLLQHGRINNIWVETYLNRQNFTERFQTLTEKYKSFDIDSSVRNNLSYNHPCYPRLEWNTFCEITARRHALLEILSDNDQWSGLFEQIFTSFRDRNPGEMYKLLEILDVAKIWGTDPVIRCFGGVHTLNSIDFKNILKYQEIIQINIRNNSANTERNNFLVRLLRSRNNDISSDKFLMDESQFNEYLRILKDLNGQGFGYLLDLLGREESESEKWWPIIERMESDSLREVNILYRIKTMLKSIEVPGSPEGDDSIEDYNPINPNEWAIIKNFSRILSAFIGWWGQSRRPAGPIRRIIAPGHIRVEWERIGDVLTPDHPIRRTRYQI